MTDTPPLRFAALDLGLLVVSGVLVLPLASLGFSATHVSMRPGTAIGILLAFFAILPAVLDGALPATVRHLYNLHYVAMAGLASIFWLLGVLGFISDADLARELALAGMIASGPIVIAHLLASATPHTRQSALLAAIGTLLVLCLLHAGGFIAMFVFAAAAIIASLYLKDEPPIRERKASAGWGLVSYLWVNVVAVLGLLPVLAIIVYAQWKAIQGGTVFAGDFSALNPVPLADAVVETIVFRWMAAFAALGVGALGVYLWPQSAVDPLRRALCVGLVALSGIAMQQLDSMHALTAVCLSALALCIAGSGVAHLPRAERGPWAIAAAGIAGTIALQCRAPAAESPVSGALIWFAEGVGTAIVWFVAYTFGLRKIRLRSVLPEPAIKSEAPLPVMTSR